VALVAILLRLFTGWLFALPLVLFEKVRPSDALRQSGERAQGHRCKFLLWIFGWALASMVLTAATTSIVIWLSRSFVPQATGSLVLLFFAIGITLLLWIAVNLAINLLSTTVFATILFNLYRYFACKSEMDLSQLGFRKTKAKQTRFQLSRSRLIAIGIAGAAVAIAVGVLAMQSVCLEDNVTIIAHRGSSKAAPENTIAAVRKAIEDWADWIEIDVQETADGEVVVFHDRDFRRLTGINLKIWEATIADLRDIDVGTWFAPEFKDERVPTLSEVLQECKGNIRVKIELKHYGYARQLEQRVARIVEANDMTSDVAVMSLKMDAVRTMMTLRPDWKIGFLMSVSAGNLKNIKADFLAVNGSFINRNLIRSTQKSGKEVYVWTVNEAPTMSNLIGHGIDGIITDRPLLARLVLEQRAEMSVPERLLLELAALMGVRSNINPSIDDA
jgi:glycerophosphoryl diester phosphodiesterase